MIVVDADGLFSGMFKKTFQETLLIPVHAFSRGNQKAIRNEGFHRYLNKLHNINASDKGSFRQWLQGVFFAMYAWNAGPEDRTDIGLVPSQDAHFFYMRSHLSEHQNCALIFPTNL